MKQLVIARHAKSSWAQPGLSDHDRPLNSRGRRVAPLMGEALAQRGGLPDVVFSSTALRARSTAGMLAGAMGFPDAAITETSEIYEASTARLLKVLREIDESHASAMLVGHVPGVHDLTNSLCRDAAIGHFPTCGIARIELEIDYWGEIAAATGKLVELLIPKEILPPGIG